jgi:hypothetical protein
LPVLGLRVLDVPVLDVPAVDGPGRLMAEAPVVLRKSRQRENPKFAANPG